MSLAAHAVCRGSTAAPPTHVLPYAAWSFRGLTTSSVTVASRLPVPDSGTTFHLTTAAGPVFSYVQTETENVTVRPHRYINTVYAL